MNSYCHRLLHSFFLLLFAILVAGTGRYAGAHAVKCLPDQEASLLDLNQGFLFRAELSEPLVSWKQGSNCCSWEGVTCDTVSGHVIGLDLGERNIFGNLRSSLFNLTSLQTLNLGWNHFRGAPIPQSGFERLTKLTHLYLNYTGLSGQIPIGISRLTSLISLDLSQNELQLRNPSLQMLVKNLSNLRELHLILVNMSSEHDWSKTLSKSLPRLQVLSLVDCGLPGSLPNDFFTTNKNLTDLDISFNPRLPGALPDFPTDNALKRLSLDGVNMSSEHDWSKTLSKSLPRLQVLSLQNCDLPGSLPNDFFSTYKKLTYLDLSENRRLSGVLPDFPTDNALQILYLFDSNFSGPISASIANLTQLVYMDLSGNCLTGVIPSIGSLIQLENLVLSGNCLTGVIPTSIGSLIQLKSMVLSGNCLTGVIPTSIGSLIQLKYMDLSGNCLTGVIPTSIGSLIQLENLVLSGNCLTGVIPTSIGSLIQLESMDLSGNCLTGVIPTSIGSLIQLEKLVLSGNCLTGVIPTSIGSLIQLESMDLSGNCLTGVIPTSIGSLIQLENLVLSGNCLTGVIPTSIGSLIQLESMDLSSNSLNGPVPSFEPQAKLSELYLYNNNLTGPIPMSLFCLPHLETLDLSYNQFFGELGEFLNSSTSLLSIDLSNNQLQGWIPRSISKMSGLESFYIASNNFSVELDMFNSLGNLADLSVSNNKLIQDVSENNFHTFPKLYAIDLASCNLPKIPAFLRYQDRLQTLDLSNNRINGSIPKWIWRVPDFLNLSFNSFSNIEGPIDLTTTNLQSLYLQSNMLQGPIPLLPPGISALDYSNNNFSSTIPSNIFFNLNNIEFFSLANNIITGEIPPSICTAKILRVLDFSNNSLSGSIPSCLLEGNNSLVELNLRGNELRGIIPQNISKGCKLERIMFDGNSLQGQLPRSLINCISLEVIDLGNNHIMDSFPYWLRDLVTLRVLILRANKFYGPINCVRSPGINYALPKLQIFDLSSNHFNGSLPSECFNALKAMLNSSQLNSSTVGLILDHLNFTSNIYIDDVVSITNKGEKSIIRKLLTIFTYVDFSNNAFEGDIPEVIGELQGLHVLNLSHNFLSGDIPPTIGNMKQIESLDLSANSLSGEIPKEMVSLTFLSYLNLSDNNFIGKIPQGNQFSTFSNASFQENPGLCGSPLSKQCGNASPKITDAMSPSKSDSSSSTYIIGLALFVGLGFGVGFAVVLVLQNVPLKFWRKQ